VRRRPTPGDAERRRRNQRLIAILASAVVVVVIVVLVLVKVAGGGSSINADVSRPVTPAQLERLSSLPTGALVAMADLAGTTSINPPTNLPPGATVLTNGGKPEILYVGAEYCPFCAAERWPLVMALLKFGTFSNLSHTKSSSTDVNPNTPTFTFYGSSYSSPYLVFTPVETENRAGKPLQTLTTEQQQIVSTYDNAPYISGQPGSIPFIYFAGKYLVSGTQYDGSALSGKTFENALTYIISPTTTTAMAAQAVAAHLIGVICSLTNDQPSSVCSNIPAELKTGQSTAANQGSSGG
jgi:hypothetical protein